MKTVIFVHGFGVLQDARGMFTDVSKVLASEMIRCVLFDLNVKDDSGNIVVNAFSKQVELLTHKYEENDEGDTYLVCHSQGCVVAALADLQNIRKTIFLAPPIESTNAKTMEYFKKNPSTVINEEGESRLARRDGTFTIVPSRYWDEKVNLNLSNLYKKYTSSNDVVVVKALLDEVISNDMTDEVFEKATVYELEADHNFTGDSRPLLVTIVEEAIR